MPYSIVTASTVEPVTDREAMEHLRVDSQDEVPYIRSLITSARIEAETFTRRQFCTATYRLTMDAFPCEQVIKLDYPPLQSVSSIAYLSSVDGTTTTMPSSDYTVDTYSTPGRIMPLYGTVWPTARDTFNSVTITFVAGYGAPSAVPVTAKTAIKMAASHWFKNREPVNIGNITSVLPQHARNLLSTEKWGDYP